ncbi:NAD-dependent epimerase/dehydratase family protein [Candidatus Woesearchaeota archaeon]|nr:NAD-dependent epimerase/dehydratase family protein [Candidatus Woesearchaeota archaeon]
MKILVTGGAGFIGSQVVDKYIEEGHTVVIVDSLVAGDEKNINLKATFYKCDITSLELKTIFEKEKPDVVNHHAAQMNVRKSIEDPMYDAQTNVLGLINVLSCAVEAKVKKFIFISSGGAMYGDAPVLPTPEETHPTPLSPYGLAKHIGEQYVQLFHRLYGMPYVILRYANVYGPRQNPLGEAGVIAIFIDNMLNGKRAIIFGDGQQTRDYVYVADVVAANSKALTAGENKILNLGTEKEVSVLELHTIVQEVLTTNEKPVFAEKKQGEVFRGALQCRAAENVLGWKATVNLKEGIQKTAQWFKEQRGTQ